MILHDARLIVCSSLVCAALLSVSGCSEDRSPRCSGSVFECREEAPQWPIRTAAPLTYTSDEDQVTDKATGLMWQRRLSVDMRRWETARAYCDELDLAGHTDWRLPSRIELLTLVDYEAIYGADKVSTVPTGVINVAAFPETPPAEFWTESYFVGKVSATSLTGSSKEDLAWTINFGTGAITAQPRELLVPRTRCVRSEKPSSSESTERFQLLGTETATDRATGLTWQRKVSPRASHAAAAAACATLGLRLPHVKELLSLVAAVTDEGPYVDPAVFQEPLISYDGTVWTSNPAGSMTTRGVVHEAFLLVDLANRGQITTVGGSWDDVANTLEVSFRCVKAASPGSAAPGSEK